MSSPELPAPALRDVAIAVATEAAALVRARRGDGVAVAATKSTGTDIVTAIDRESEALLQRRLGELRPGDGFLGEEGGDTGSTTGITWVVDPIDGTVNFVYDIAPYAVSVGALDEQRETLAGAVVDVTSGAVYSAARGQGASVDGRPLQVRAAAPMHERLVLTGFEYSADRRVLQARAVAEMIGKVRDVRRLGSAALDLCAVARGAADAYVEEGPHLWDRAAAQLIVTEAGGRVGIHPGVGGMDCVVAAPASTYDELVELVRACGFLAPA